MKILLMCGAGASSGFMAQAMRKAAKEQGIENFEIIARSEAEMMNNLQGTDLVMFGPHLAFKREALEKDLKKFNIPFAFIDKDAYGSIDGAATLKQALDALREVKKPVEEISVKEEKPTQSSEASEEPAKGFMGWITKSLAPKLDKLTQNIYISAIQQSIMSILPMIMIGSVSSIVGVFRNFEVMSWIPDISMLNTYSFGLIAVFLAILVPMKVLEKRGNEKLKISAMLTSLALFFIITLPVIDGEAGTMNFIMDKIGTGGMLTAVVTSVFTAWIFNFASRHSMFKEDTVMPDMVVAWMDALVPVTITLAIGLFIMSTGFDLPLFIRGLFAPISSFGQTWLGLVMICFFTCFLYSFGFTWILFPIAWAIWMEGMDANMAAVAAGQAASSINLMETVMGITYIGGQGCTLALVLMCMRSNVKKLKSIGRVCIFPAIFNINETMTFGLPIVLNPILAIPFMFAPVISATFAYWMTVIGFAQVISFQVPWTTPVGIMGFLATGGHIGTAITQIICVALSVVIYTPFVLISNKQAQMEENQA